MKNNKKKIFSCIYIVVNIVLIGMISSISWTTKDYSANQKKNAHLIGVSYMTMNNEFYKIVSEEINAKVESEGDQLILRDPALNAERQIEQIEEMLDKGIDVLVVTPVDWQSLTSVLKRAKEQNVYIVVVDSDVEDERLVDCTITSDNYSAGVIVGEYFLTQCNQAKVVVMTHKVAKSGQDRVRGFIDTVSRHEGITIVKEIDCEGQLEIAMPKLQQVIDEGVDFDNVFCLNDLSSIGVVAALDEKQLLDQVGVYGIDASPDSKSLIYEGMMKASAAQYPSEIGNEAAEVIYRLLEHKKVEKKILIPVELVTQDNVEEFEIDRWQ